MRDNMRIIAPLTIPLVLVLALTAMLCAAPGAGPADPPLTFEVVKARLLEGSYTATLEAAYWAMEQGEAIVPHLAAMLEQAQTYAATPENPNAFPFNALWALSRLPSASALMALEQYRAASRDPVAALAISGFKLRQAQGSAHYGVMINDGELLEQPNEKSRMITKVKAGQAVKIITRRIGNHQEESPRGGPVYYDRIHLLDRGLEGYLARPGDCFSPYF